MNPASFIQMMETVLPALEESPQTRGRSPSGLRMDYYIPRLAPTPPQPQPMLPPAPDQWALSTEYDTTLSPSPATGWTDISLPKPCAIIPARDDFWHQTPCRPVSSPIGSPSTIGPMAYPLVYPSWSTPHTTTLSEGGNSTSYYPTRLPATGPPHPRVCSNAYFTPRPVTRDPSRPGVPSCPSFPFTSGHIYAEISPNTSALRGSPILSRNHPRLPHAAVLPKPGDCSELPSGPTRPLISRPTPLPISTPNTRSLPGAVFTPTADLALVDKPPPTMSNPLPPPPRETILPPRSPHAHSPLLPRQELIVPPASATILLRCYLCRATFPALLILLQHDCSLGPAVGALSGGFPCPICPKEFDSFCDNLLHVTINHYAPQRAYPFSCPLCQARFASANNTKKHLQRVHLVPDLRCPICHHCAPSPARHATHLATHRPSVAGACHKCSRAYKYPTALRKHMLTCRAGRKSPRSLIK